MQIIPFNIHTVDLRVIKSKIGNVVPVVDIAKAIDYDYNSLKGMLQRSEELFTESLVSVTVTSHFDQKLKDGSIQHRKQKFEVKALNSYGIFGLLMKLDYTRIQSEEKKQAVIRFQKWAMHTLVKASDNPKREAHRSVDRTRGIYIDADPKLPTGAQSITSHKAAKILGISIRTLQTWVKRGLITRYYGCHFVETEVRYIAGSYKKRR